MRKDDLYSRVYASKEKVISLQKKQESVMRERLDDEDSDDANIPEEEH